VTISEKLFQYIQTNKPNPYCDDCLCAAIEASSRQTVNARTEAFGLCRDFTKEKRVCAKCNEMRLATSAN
jgi:hypothetical protein